VQAILASGLDVNSADYDGRTALHLAASEGKTELVRYLLSHGAFHSSKDRQVMSFSPSLVAYFLHGIDNFSIQVQRDPSR
jgi:ankyrin repeat protein